MIRDLYSAAAGLLSTALEESVVAGNLANVSTPGYQEQEVAFAPFHEMAMQANLAGNTVSLGAITGGAEVSVTTSNWTPGAMQASSNPLAVAIAGSGFFAVQTARGQVAYTRAGDFQFNGAGELVNADGQAVLATTGQPIQAASQAEAAGATVNTNGQVVSGGTVLGQIAVWNPALTSLVSAGDAEFTQTAGAAAPGQMTASLDPGFLQGSNVNLIGQMADLIRLDQVFASDQNALETAQQTMTTAISTVGTVS